MQQPPQRGLPAAQRHRRRRRHRPDDFLPDVAAQRPQRADRLHHAARIQQQVVIVPEPITNTLLISATPQYFDEVMRLIGELDSRPPQVVIQVLIAEVEPDRQQGVRRRDRPAEPGAVPARHVPDLAFSNSYSRRPDDRHASFANAVGGQILPGVTVANSNNPTAQPGFNFNNVTVPLGNNPVVGPASSASRGWATSASAAVSPNSGVGGFVFSAASDSFNLLIRALKMQGRLDVLSRPQVMTLDNQPAQSSSASTSRTSRAATSTATGIDRQTHQLPRRRRRSCGDAARSAPTARCSCACTRSVVGRPTARIDLGNGILATAFNIQLVETTVIAERRRDGGHRRPDHASASQKNENKIPWLGDLPGVGGAVPLPHAEQGRRASCW